MSQTTPSPLVGALRMGAGPVLVEVDSSYESGEALRWAAGFSRCIGVGLEATCTWQPGLGEFRPDAHEAVVRRLRGELRRWSVLAKDVFVEPECRVVEGDWPAAILNEAEARGASLIAVPLAANPSSSAARSEATARQLLHRSTLPVALVPTSGANRVIRRIVVVATDPSSPPSLIAWAVMLAEAYGAELHVVSVLPLIPEWVPSSDPTSPWQVERQARMRRWTPTLDGRHIRHQIHVVESSRTGDAVAHTARQVHGDLVLTSVGTSGPTVNVRRAPALCRLARDTGLVVVSIPSNPEIDEA